MYPTRAVSILALTTTALAAMTGCGRTEPTPARGPSSSASSTTTPSAPAPSSAGPTILPFKATIGGVDRQMLRYSWRPGCPVPLKGLRLITMPYWGFDKQSHSGGKLVVNADVAKDIAGVFKKLYDQRYPIRKMELVDVYKGSDFDSIEAGNTSAFNCRQATGSSNWSRHAFGMAVDLNPCENPYVNTAGTISHKRCAKYYKNRSAKQPGVITAGDKTVRAFRTIGWNWGGSWAGTKDYQHFSDSR